MSRPTRSVLPPPPDDDAPPRSSGAPAATATTMEWQSPAGTQRPAPPAQLKEPPAPAPDSEGQKVRSPLPPPPSSGVPEELLGTLAWDEVKKP